MAHALDRHVALVGFMGAGKTTLGAVAAQVLGRRFVDLDRELESKLHETIPEIFARRGELEFRVLEQATAVDRLTRGKPAVLALGGAWYLTSRLNAASANLIVTNRAYNAAVLAQAKQALIARGYELADRELRRYDAAVA